jgi:tRNA/rRNA methyltransferase/tRNA (cytidine32/uridine32-2'-O)-methyltransferase
VSLADLTQQLNAIRIVLVETSHPGNIGSVARAMKTMGLSQLVLVKPKIFPDGLATAMASGAADILANAIVVDTLGKAIESCTLVIGTSARLRVSAWPQLDAKGAAQVLLSHQQKGGQVAMVFGRESSGLTNGELDLCHYLGHVPTNPDYGSLNLAMGVQIFTYELWMQAQQQAGWMDRVQQPKALATSAAMNGFYQHLESTLEAIEFLDDRNHEPFMRRMKRLFGRVKLEANEVTMLRGTLRRMQRIAGLAKRYQQIEED